MRFILLHLRLGSSCHSLFGGQLRDKVGDEAGPARLVRSATAAAIVTVEVLVEGDIVLEMGIALEVFIPSENGRLPPGSRRKILMSRRYNLSAVTPLNPW